MEKNLLNEIYQDSLSLLTDLYELTMAYAYWKEGMQDDEATFQLFFRKKPFGGGYAVAAGLEIAVDYIKNFAFKEDDLEYLSTLKNPAGGALFEPAFLEYLKDFRMRVNVDAMEEGTPVFPNQPIIRVSGPIIEAQILESALLNIVNFQTLIATKASRVRFAAGSDHVVEFGLRRAQGIDGAIAASRASFIGGCDSSSNVLAGKLFGIPVMGTHAHSFVMSFDEEKEAFGAFARSLPENCIFLIDTYDTMKGVAKAIEVTKEQNLKLIAVRLDSGDLLSLSKEVRKALDAAGLKETKIMATNELTEEIIADVKANGGKISLWGVGTNLVTAKDQPALDGVYKLSAFRNKGKEWQHRLKISEQLIKTTNPGISQVRRFYDDRGYVADMLYDEGIGPGNVLVMDDGSSKEVDPSWRHKDLLVPMLRGGKEVYPFPSLEGMRNHTLHELERFPKGLRALKNPKDYVTGMDKGLFDKKQKMIEELS